jgi:excisionase family DNA binding protein
MSQHVWYSLNGAIDYIGGDVHPQTIRRWVREGRLKASRPTPRCLRFRRDWLDDFLAGGPTDAPAEAHTPPVVPARSRGQVISITDRRR